MNKNVSRCLFICVAAVCLISSISAPSLLSDQNAFLRDFVNHEFLNLLGVIVAITLASSANLHLEFNKIEEHAGRAVLTSTRGAVKRSAGWLIAVFCLAFFISLIKPLLPDSEVAMSLVNSIVILIFLFNILVLIDLTRLVFRIEPEFDPD